jgi:arylamine N-acetyltransferase
MDVTAKRPSRGWVDRYLQFLGISREAPSLEALTRLEQAHIRAIPFTNVGSILRRADTPAEQPVLPLDPEETLRSWEDGLGGGVCFETSGMICRLLEELGYHAHAVLADSSFPGSHQAVLVHLSGSRYLVDAGNGAPFFPVRLNGEQEVRRVGLAYRFRQGPQPQTWEQDRWIEGKWSHSFEYHLDVPTDEALEAAYQRHHTPGRSWVMDELRVVCCSERDVKAYRNGRFTHYNAAGKRSQEVSQLADIVSLIQQEFGFIRLRVADALVAQADFSGAAKKSW